MARPPPKSSSFKLPPELVYEFIRFYSFSQGLHLLNGNNKNNKKVGNCRRRELFVAAAPGGLSSRCFFLFLKAHWIRLRNIKIPIHADVEKLTEQIGKIVQQCAYLGPKENRAKFMAIMFSRARSLAIGLEVDIGKNVAMLKHGVDQMADYLLLNKDDYQYQFLYGDTFRPTEEGMAEHDIYWGAKDDIHQLRDILLYFASKGDEQWHEIGFGIILALLKNEGEWTGSPEMEMEEWFEESKHWVRNVFKTVNGLFGGGDSTTSNCRYELMKIGWVLCSPMVQAFHRVPEKLVKLHLLLNAMLKYANQLEREHYLGKLNGKVHKHLRDNNAAKAAYSQGIIENTNPEKKLDEILAVACGQDEAGSLNLQRSKPKMVSYVLIATILDVVRDCPRGIW